MLYHNTHASYKRNRSASCTDAIGEFDGQCCLIDGKTFALGRGY